MQRAEAEEDTFIGMFLKGFAREQQFTKYCENIFAFFLSLCILSAFFLPRRLSLYLPFSLSVSFSIYLYSLSLSVSLCLSLSLSVSLCLSLSLSVSLCLSLYLSVLSVSLCLSLSLSLSVSVSLCLSVCLSVSLYFMMSLVWQTIVGYCWQVKLFLLNSQANSS